MRARHRHARLPGISASIALVVLMGCRAEISQAPPRPNETTDEPSGTPSSVTPKETKPGRKPKPTFTIRKRVENGCVEDHEGLRVVRLWGSPEERGTAHGQLVGAEVVDLMRRELTERFGKRRTLLDRARALLNLMIAFPKPVRREVTAIFEAIEAQAIDLEAPELGRDLDLNDALILNAMDQLVQIGCSGFTVFGDQVAGGGVLTGRNFDWPMTGPYLVESCCLIVQHPDEGAAHAAIAWPGYVGSVTGVNEHGVAVFLHYGDSEGGLPRPGAYPTATAAREILQQSDREGAFEVARDMLAKTCPPRGYLTRVIRPLKGSESPLRVFEADSRGVTRREQHTVCVVTNHFLSRGERGSFQDSKSRFDKVTERLENGLKEDDRKISVSEAWSALAAVERDGSDFGTQHSVVFRPDPWVFEIAVGVLKDGVLQAAPSKGKRFAVSRGALFRDPR